MNRKTKRMEKKKNRKYVLVIWILAVVILLFGIIFTGKRIWNKYRDNIINQQEEQMLIISDSLAGNLEETVNGYALDLKYLARLIDRGDDESVLKAYLNNGNQYIGNISYYDAQGNILWQDHTLEQTDWFEEFELDNEITMNVVKSADNKIYFLLSKILAGGNRLEMAVDVKAYYLNMISDIKIGTNGYVVLKNKDGVIFMHPSDEQLGETVIEGRTDLYGKLDLDGLEELMIKQNENENGVNEYYSYWWTDENLPKVKKISAFTHVNLGSGYMIVSIVRDYDDFYEPLSDSFVVVESTFFLILVVIIFFAAIVIFQFVKGLRNEQEIQYLKDLNEVLEETKRSEEVIAHQQRLQIMGTMTGGIAHEFNNLLTPIMGYSEMLVDTLTLGSEEADFAKEILEASDKAKDVIKQIAGLSRKNMETVFSFVPLKKALRRSIKMVRSVCPANVVLIEGCSLESEGFLGNETQLNQVILNICVNAFHAIGKEKEGIVSIHAEKVDSVCIMTRHNVDTGDVLNGFLCITIEDNGCGMDTDVLEKIFDPFFTTKSSGQGTGLGLSVVEQIVHSHKGYIFAKSKIGVGTGFFIYLPVAIKTDITSDGNAENALQNSAVDLSILVVDDNGKVLRLLEKKFKKLGIFIETASSTKEATEKLKIHPFDVLAIDQDQGILFAMTVGQEYPEMIRIVMAEQIKKEIIEAKQHGYIEGYVEKPVSDSKLLEEIRRYSM